MDPFPTSTNKLRPMLVEGGVAMAIAVAVYLFSCLLVAPKPESVGFGLEWQRMAGDPFGLSGLFPHRLLAPLLAWLLGFGSEHYVGYVRGLHVVMLTCGVLYARRLGTTRLDAALIAIAVAVTAPVQMYKWHWVSYCDPLSYSLFLIAAMCVRHTTVFWVLFFFNLTTHELAAFMLPWCWYLRRCSGAPWRVDAAWVTAVFGTYAAYYFLVRHFAVQHTFSYDFFVENPLLPFGAIAIWAMAMTHWLLAFGPVLAVLGWHWHTAANVRERWQLWLVVAGIVAILGIAFDWMRHANLILLPFVLASARFLVSGHRRAFVVLVAATLAFLVSLPPWSAVQEPTGSLWKQVDELVLQVKPVDFSRVVTEWLPVAWPTLLWVYAALGAVWFVGYAIARRDARGLTRDRGV